METKKQMFKRKINEVGSTLYRALIFPFVKIGIERKTGSIIKPKAYLMKGSELLGKNYIGKQTVLSGTKVGYGSYIQDKGDITNTVIGKYTSIGTDVVTIIGRHPVDRLAMHPAFYSTSEALGYTYSEIDTFDEFKYVDRDNNVQVKIGNDVWIGSFVRIMEGVTIGDGAVIGACSLVTHDVEPYAIYAGCPAKKIRNRFSDEETKKLMEMSWWNRDEEWIKKNIPGA